MNLEQSWRFDRLNEPGPDGERPVRVELTVRLGGIGSSVAVVLSEEAAAEFEKDLARVLHGGLEVAREMPAGLNGGERA